MKKHKNPRKTKTEALKLGIREYRVCIFEKLAFFKLFH